MKRPSSTFWLLLLLSMVLARRVCGESDDDSTNTTDPVFRRELFYFNWGSVLQGDYAGAVQNYGKWCGARNSGLSNCCNGGACSACTAAADQWQYPDSYCKAQCPPVDAVDALCMNHDFCITQQQYRTGSITSCTYNPTWFTTIPANYCACDKALYDGVVALGGNDGFKANLKAWLSSSWGKCFKLGSTGWTCVPFLGNVAPAPAPPPRSPPPRYPPPPPPRASNCCCIGWCWTPWCCSKTCRC